MRIQPDQDPEHCLKPTDKPIKNEDQFSGPLSRRLPRLMPRPPALVEMRKSRILWLVGLLKYLHHILRVSAPVLPSSLQRGENPILYLEENVYMLHNLNSMQFFFRHKHVENLYLKITNQASTGLLKHSHKSFIDLSFSLPSPSLLLFWTVIQGDIGQFGQKYEKGYKKNEGEIELKE